MTWTREAICRARGLDPATFALKLIGTTAAEWDSSAVAFKAVEMSRQARRVDAAIRGAAGRPVPTPAELAALDAGLPIELADRLRGDDPDALAVDAVALAAALGRKPGGPDFDDRVRTAAGRPPAQPDERNP